MFAKKDVPYTPARSAGRLRVLQQFCCADGAAPFAYFVPGPDGVASAEEDAASQAVARYLFKGDYGRTLRNSIISD